MSTKRIVTYLLGEVLSLAGMAVALFWSAGRVDWWPAWAALTVMFSWMAVTDIQLLRNNPDLLLERISRRGGAKKWDTILMSVFRLITLARYIVAGLDQRHGWTGDFPIAVQLAALIVCALGYVLFSWAMLSNAFFSQIVRIQTDRGQNVVTGGPYKIVRHPAYIGSILYELAVPILLASWWSFALCVINAGLMIFRTALEDRTLKAELAGYAEYARKVRYRLLPGIW